MTAFLEVNNLTKAFGGVRAVNGLDFSLDQGELHCVIGPNGAGKSTFLGVLAGLHRADQGEIRWKGKNITRLQPHQRARVGIALKFQTTRIYRNLSVRDNLRISRRWRDDPAAGARSDRATDSLGLDELWNVPAAELSHPQQQWLEIALTLATQPDLLLLDEPTSGMTVEEAARTAEILRTLQKHGLALLVVEHDMAFVRALRAPVTVLHFGCAFARGSFQEIAARRDVQEIYLGERSHA